MKLANNIVRINGYVKGKRTHVDVEVPIGTIRYYTGDGKEIAEEVPMIYGEDHAAKLGFRNGLDAVTSYNFWNNIGDERMTIKIW
jgi:hypothetical protein